MKVLARILVVSTVVTLLAGCASDVVYVPKVPALAQAKLLDYFEQPDNKVFVIAIDPGGDYAFGYDYGKSSLKEAARVAVEKCDAQREAYGIIAKPYIYAVNDRVVYEEMIMKAHGVESQGVEQEQEAQIEAAAEADASEEADTGEEAPAEAEQAFEM